MPISIRVRDNTSVIKVKADSSQDNIPIECGGEIDTKRLESLIHAEEKSRIEADENLQYQILNKEDKVHWIEILTSQGTFDSEVLNLLISSRLNKIVYQNRIYSLATKDESIWRYTGSTNDPNIINTIVVNVETGEYAYSMIRNQTLEEHIADNSRHITNEERDFWDNKVTADAILENPKEQGYKLNLSKN